MQDRQMLPRLQESWKESRPIKETFNHQTNMWIYETGRLSGSEPNALGRKERTDISRRSNDRKQQKLGLIGGHMIVLPKS